MKTLFYALLGILLVGTGCSKENSVEDVVDNRYVVRFTVDGVAKEYFDHVLAVRSESPLTYTVTVQGLQDLSPNPAGMSVMVAQATPISAKTYAEDPVYNSPALLYRDTTDAPEFTNLYVTGPSGVEVVISEIDAETVRGTFSGAIADVNGNMRVITDGSFYAKFQ